MNNFISINSIYLRKINYLTQPDLASVCGVNRDFISALENNKKKHFEIEFFQKLSKHFEISIDDFINTDLSKGKNTSKHFVKEPETNYEKDIDSKTIEAYNKIISNYEELVLTKDKLLEERMIRISVLDKTIESLEKQLIMLETLLNQNGVNQQSPFLDKLQALIKIQNEIEQTVKKQQNANN